MTSLIRLWLRHGKKAALGLAILSLACHARVAQAAVATAWAERLGQNFIVGIPGSEIDDSTEKVLRAIQPAGIVLYFRNCPSRQQTKSLIQRLQNIAQDSTGHPYLILLDEEPGGATRLGLFHHVFRLGHPDWYTIQHDIGILTDVGINVDLAPLADYPFNQDTFIARRLPPVDRVEDLMEFNRAFIDALHQQKVAATLKHFPGMGVFVDDPHHKLPYFRIQGDVFQNSLRVFRDGIVAGADFVMTAHGVYGNVDDDHPVATSHKIVTGLLRETLGFQGIIMTDDLSDMRYSIHAKVDLAGAVLDSLRAGHNLVMFSHRLEKTQKIFREVLQRAIADPALQVLLRENHDKIVGFKKARCPFRKFAASHAADRL